MTQEARYSFYGVNKDVDPTILKEDKWSDCNNVRFKDGYAVQSPDFGEFNAEIPNPTYLSSQRIGGAPVIFIGNNTDLYKFNGVFSTNVSKTQGAYQSGDWDATYYNTVTVMTNGSDKPQYLLPSSLKFEDMDNFPDGTVAELIRSFKGFLIAGRLTKGGVESFSDVLWSNVAAPGGIPKDWDITDTASLAGETTLADDPSPIQAMEILKDRLLIYKEESTYSMTFKGGGYVFDFRKVSGEVGAINRHCVKEYSGKHFVVDINEFYVTDGVSRKDIGNAEVYRYFTETVDVENKSNIFVMKDEGNTEMAICFPTIDIPDGTCTKALVWNWKDAVWSVRDLPGVTFGAVGELPSKPVPTWDTVTSSWEDYVGSWSDTSFSLTYKPLFIQKETGHILQAGSGTVVQKAMLERTGLEFGNPRTVKTIDYIIPDFFKGGEVEVYLGGRMQSGNDYKWKGPFKFDAFTKNRVTARVTGRQLGVRFVSETLPEVSGVRFFFDVNGER